MKLTILGSGGAMTTPRPFCQCESCKKARLDSRFKRNSSSLLINDINTLIDCGEDIADSLNKNNVNTVDNLLITHWHPDHTFGLRTILEANYNFRTNKADKQINLYIPKKVYETLKIRFPAIEYLINVIQVAKLFLIKDGDELEFNKIKIRVVGYSGKESDTYAFLIQEGSKKALYSPCDTIGFDNYNNFHDLDLLINECGIFSKINSEISFDKLIERIKEIRPKQTILTHIENVELKIWGEKHFNEMEYKHKDLNIKFAHDGMELKI